MIPSGSYSGYPTAEQMAEEPKQKMYEEMLKKAKTEEQAKSKAKVKQIDLELAKINAEQAAEDMLSLYGVDPMADEQLMASVDTAVNNSGYGGEQSGSVLDRVYGE